jgi:hypothetical protein
MSDKAMTDDDAVQAVTIALSEIPLIDFTPFREGDQAERQRVADQIARACETIGVFYLSGHGVPESVVVEPLADLVARDGEARYTPVHVGTLLSRFFKSSKYIPIPQDPAVG